MKSYSQHLDIDNSGFFYQIAPIFEFKQGVVSLTFDDGSRNQFDIGIPLLKEKGLPATFYLITKFVDSHTINQLIKENSSEFEFGSHTATHPDLIKIGASGDYTEFSLSKSFLTGHFGIASGLTMSYPWGIYNKSVKKIASEYFMAARTTDPGYNSFYSLDRYALKTQGFDKDTPASLANSWVNEVIQRKVWLIEMLHGINGIGFSPIDSAVFAEHLDYIVNAGDQVWCSTVSNVIKYLDESENAIVECDNCSDTLFNIRTDDFLDDSIYDQPLTVKINVPSDWDKIAISEVDSFRTEVSNKSKFVIFNTLPDNQYHTIRPLTRTVSEKETGMKIVYLSANPFNDNIKLTIEVLEQSDIDVILCDLNGKILSHQAGKSVKRVIDLYIETSHLTKGLYFLRIKKTGRNFIIKKMIKE